METVIDGKYSKILNAFLFLFSNKMLVFRVGTCIHKIVVRIANRAGPGSALFVLAILAGNLCLKF